MDIEKTKIIRKVIILVIIILVIITYNIFFNNTTKNLGKYLTKKGYTHEKDSYVYIKQNSELTLEEYYEKLDNKETSVYEALSFNTKTYILTKIKRGYLEKVDYTLNLNYDYKKNKIAYNYRAVIDENASIIYEGDYQYKNEEETFSCEQAYSYNFNIDKNDSDVCYTLRNETRLFYQEVLDEVQNSKLINQMTKSK